jgi:hypothetical protein
VLVLVLVLVSVSVSVSVSTEPPELPLASEKLQGRRLSLHSPSAMPSAM